MAAAENPNCPEEVLEVLAQDHSWEVRMGVFSNPSCPHWLLEAAATEKLGLGDGIRRLILNRSEFSSRLVLAARMGPDFPSDPAGLRAALDAVLGETSPPPPGEYACWPQTSRGASFRPSYTLR